MSDYYDSDGPGLSSGPSDPELVSDDEEDETTMDGHGSGIGTDQGPDLASTIALSNDQAPAQRTHTYRTLAVNASGLTAALLRRSQPFVTVSVNESEAFKAGVETTVKQMLEDIRQDCSHGNWFHSLWSHQLEVYKKLKTLNIEPWTSMEGRGADTSNAIWRDHVADVPIVMWSREFARLALIEGLKLKEANGPLNH